MKPSLAAGNYERSVFINCPFDEAYRPIMNAVVFTLVECGFTPRCVLELRNSSEYRLEKIINLIRECKYGIHDLSRTELDSKSKLPRFNMPFELGLFVGARSYGTDKQKTKNFMVFDRQKYRYQKFISDIAGQDIFSHQNKPKIAIQQVHSWLGTSTNIKTMPPSKKIMDRYATFTNDLPQLCDAGHLEAGSLSFVEYSWLVSTWLGVYFKK